jgi:hypothetical protein
MLTKLAKFFIKVKKRMAGHCDTSDGSGSGHCD